MKVTRAVFRDAPTIGGTTRSVSLPDWEMGIRPEGLLITHPQGVTLVPWGCIRQVEMEPPASGPATQAASQAPGKVPKLKGGA